MEDVKDTLWKWFVQLSAVLGLCFSIYAAYTCASLLLHLPRTPPERTPGYDPDALRMVRIWMISAGLLLGPMLGTVWFRMMLMRKWAAWVICVLGAWATLTSLALVPRFAVVSTLLAFGPGSEAMSSYLWRAVALTYVVMLGCALILKPRIWRKEM